ncbi:MAG: cellulose biosynthesis cyclic di-GMP-binding regulatory protein BcsB [Methylophilaceae bacterium]|nr:cellulose biosynthesis cyclic di-GMP-binding regulatory protein BcsB [Methylophilaceae bacterium]
MFTRLLLVLGYALLSAGLAHAGVQRIQLDQLHPEPVLALTCVSDERGLDIPIPERWALKKTTLVLHYTSSNTLLGDQAQMVIKINGFPIGQIKLNPTSPDMVVKINLPTTYLEAGYNRLSFMTSMHVPRQGESCEPFCSPDMWTHINLKDSSLEAEYDEIPVPLSLSSIADYLFDPKIFPAGRVNLIVEDRSPASLTALAIASSGIARRFDYRKVVFEVSETLRPGMDNVLVGRTSFVDAFLRARGLELGQSQGGYLKIFHLPLETGGTDPAHALIVLTGEQYDKVKLAAETFANLSLHFPGSQEMTVLGLEMPNIQAHSGRGVLRANQAYTFKALGLPTTTFKGINNVGKAIHFRLPPDFLVKENRAAKLKLNFAYGAGMHPTSALNIEINGAPVRAIHIGDANGAMFENYQIDIPTYLFKPGDNTLSFGVELHPDHQQCDVVLLGNLFLTLFENSTLTFPEMPHFAEMPRLELFMLNGFPFTRWPDGHESRMLITDTSEQNIAAAMNVVGLMSQKNGHPLLGMQIETQLTEPLRGDTIVIGPIDKIPQRVFKHAPLRFDTAFEVPYPVLQDNEKHTLAYVTQKSRLGPDRALIMEFESPDESGRSVMLITAEQGHTLSKFSAALLEPEIQVQVKGGLVLVDMHERLPKPKVTSLETGAVYTTGKSGRSLGFEAYLYAHPWAYYGLIAILTLGLAAGSWWGLKRYRTLRELRRISQE